MRPARAQRGYTLIEVLAALMVLAAGVLGIISMQAATVSANRRAHELTVATNIARRWQERLRRDSFQWNDSSLPLSSTNTLYLRQIGTAEGAWFIPTSYGGTGTTPLESAAFDYWGNDVNLSTAPGSVYYCAHLRYRDLSPYEPGRLPSGLLRAEVRVWWYREGGVRPPSYINCAAGALTAIGLDSINVHWVYLAQTLRRHER